MKIRNLDKDSDWAFGKSKSNYITGNAGVALNIKTKLLEWKNDCFFNLPAGIDWRTRMGMKKQKELLDEDIKNIIVGVDEVITLNEFESYVEEREYTLRFNITTIYSESYTDTFTMGLENA